MSVIEKSKAEIPLSFPQNPDFAKLWLGETISFFGTQISSVAFPLAAITLLEAFSTQVGILNASAYVPFLIFTFAGVYVDRSKKRPILIVSNIGRSTMILLFPFAIYFDFLSIELMYIIVFILGFFTVFFDVTFQTYIPFLVDRDHLVKANARITASSSTAWIIGPGIGGFFV
ncbi:hypothetical protein CVD28_12405 [Bacillus sp. M6-12]|nr:hypothetical protein CVD28_12405 [Bacillus sp. M6-12]